MITNTFDEPKIVVWEEMLTYDTDEKGNKISDGEPLREVKVQRREIATGAKLLRTKREIAGDSIALFALLEFTMDGNASHTMWVPITQDEFDAIDGKLAKDVFDRTFNIAG